MQYMRYNMRQVGGHRGAHDLGCSAFSKDGLSSYYGRDVDGGLDVWELALSITIANHASINSE